MKTSPWSRLGMCTVLVMVVVAGCARGSDPASPSPAGNTGAAAPPAAPSETADERTVDSPITDVGPVALEVVADGLDRPVDVVIDPRDGELLAVQQTGSIVTFDGEVRLDLGNRVTFGGERGLLDAVVHPDGDRMFVHYTGVDGATVLAEYTIGEATVLEPNAGTTLFTTSQPAANHNGGSVEIGPDGLLHLALGDGGRAGDAFDQAQDTSTPLGGILRFDVSVPGVATPAGAGFAEPRLWAYGLRNPWRITFDDGRLFVADVGQDAVEEVSVIALADHADSAPNFGWPLIEGDTCFAADPCDDPSMVPSIANERHVPDGGSCSITGGVVYRGDKIPSLTGGYLYSDVCEGFLKVIFTEGTTATSIVDLTGQVGVTGQIVGFGVDSDDEVLVISLDGVIRRLVPA